MKEFLFREEMTDTVEYMLTTRNLQENQDMVLRVRSHVTAKCLMLK